jgi:hypothetical protein
MKITILATIGLSILSVSSASASLLAYEGFDYADGTAINPNGTGGWGWSAGWADGDGSQLSYAVQNGVLTGNNTGGTSTLDTTTRIFNAPGGAITSGTVFFRFTGDFRTAVRLGASNSTGYLEFIQDGVPNEYIRVISDAAGGRANLGQGLVVSGAANTNIAYIYIGKYDFSTSRYTAWRFAENADLSTFDGTTGGTVINPSDLATTTHINQVTLLHRGGYIDNILVGTTAASIIPEPSAALLGGLGVLALLRRRRA